MEQIIRLIWDFRGPDGHQTAEHHAIHLREFCQKESMQHHQIDVIKNSELWSYTFMDVNKVDVVKFRDSLIPHRAHIVD